MANYPSWIEEKDEVLWLTEDDREHLQISYRLKKLFFQNSRRFNML